MVFLKVDRVPDSGACCGPRSVPTAIQTVLIRYPGVVGQVHISVAIRVISSPSSDALVSVAIERKLGCDTRSRSAYRWAENTVNGASALDKLVRLPRKGYPA